MNQSAKRRMGGERRPTVIASMYYVIRNAEVPSQSIYVNWKRKVKRRRIKLLWIGRNIKEGPVCVDVLNDDDVVDERMVRLVSFPPQ